MTAQKEPVGMNPFDNLIVQLAQRGPVKIEGSISGVKARVQVGPCIVHAAGGYLGDALRALAYAIRPATQVYAKQFLHYDGTRSIDWTNLYVRVGAQGRATKRMSYITTTLLDAIARCE